MTTRTPITGTELFQALEEYRRAAQEARETGDGMLKLSKRTHEIIQSLSQRS